MCDLGYRHIYHTPSFIFGARRVLTRFCALSSESFESSVAGGKALPSQTRTAPREATSHHTLLDICPPIIEVVETPYRNVHTTMAATLPREETDNEEQITHQAYHHTHNNTGPILDLTLFRDTTVLGE